MQTSNIKALCPAKINLTFDITGMLEDGYHEVETVYQAVSLYDQLEFCCRLDKPFAVKIGVDGTVPKEFPLTQDNIIYKAADTFCRNLPVPVNFDLEIIVHKNIPVGAGLGGGSSNAAATLMALNQIFVEPYSTDDLVKLSCKLGADVPFFFIGGLCLGTARGDKLQPLNRLKELWMVLVKLRRISVQSKTAYAQFDEFVRQHGLGKLAKPCWRAVIGDLKSGNLGNVFEAPIFESYPVLKQLKETIKSAGAICCHLTGSGSTLYGLANSQQHARSIADELSLSANAADADIFIAQGIDHGVLIGGKGENK